MTAVVITYLFTESNFSFGYFMPYYVGVIVGGSISLLILGLFIFKLFTRKNIEEEETYGR